MSFAQNHDDFVQFKITEVSKKPISDGDEIVWLASHQSAKGIAKFKISIQIKSQSGGSIFTFSEGSFIRVADSKSAGLIGQLVSALSAKKIPASSKKVDLLKFNLAILGVDRSRSGGNKGGFTSEPKGSWIVTKIFLADGEGEVYLCLDVANGVGEFSIKDEEYGDIVVKELARVL
jgi:hypothetical protein